MIDLDRLLEHFYAGSNPTGLADRVPLGIDAIAIEPYPVRRVLADDEIEKVPLRIGHRGQRGRWRKDVARGVLPFRGHENHRWVGVLGAAAKCSLVVVALGVLSEQHRLGGFEYAVLIEGALEVLDLAAIELGEKRAIEAYRRAIAGGHDLKAVARETSPKRHRQETSAERSDRGQLLQEMITVANRHRRARVAGKNGDRLTGDDRGSADVFPLRLQSHARAALVGEEQSFAFIKDDCVGNARGHAGRQIGARRDVGARRDRHRRIVSVGGDDELGAAGAFEEADLLVGVAQDHVLGAELFGRNREVSVGGGEELIDGVNRDWMSRFHLDRERFNEPARGTVKHGSDATGAQLGGKLDLDRLPGNDRDLSYEADSGRRNGRDGRCAAAEKEQQFVLGHEVVVRSDEVIKVLGVFAETPRRSGCPRCRWLARRAARPSPWRRKSAPRFHWIDRARFPRSER